MKITTLSGIVENGQIPLTEDVQVPEETVHVVLPEPPPTVHIYSPRLAHPEQIRDFEMQVREEP